MAIPEDALKHDAQKVISDIEGDIKRYHGGTLTLAQFLRNLRGHTRTLEEIAGITEAGVCDSCHTFFQSLKVYKGVTLCPLCYGFATRGVVDGGP
jgi:hypothetical protein